MDALRSSHHAEANPTPHQLSGLRLNINKSGQPIRRTRLGGQHGLLSARTTHRENTSFPEAFFAYFKPSTSLGSRMPSDQEFFISLKTNRLKPMQRSRSMFC